MSQGSLDVLGDTLLDPAELRLDAAQRGLSPRGSGLRIMSVETREEPWARQEKSWIA